MISLCADSGARVEVMSSELADIAGSLEGVTILPARPNVGEQRISRMSGLELVATFLSSAAALQLALALRDFVCRRSVDIELVSTDGSRTRLSARGADLASVPQIAAFLTGRSNQPVEPRAGRHDEPQLLGPEDEISQDSEGTTERG